MCNVLVGGCIGDALGVPFETFKSDHPLLVNWDNETFLGSKHHRLLPGQMSDDGQMMVMVAESLIEHKGFNPDDLSARYVDWIVSERARGYGRTTYIAVQRLRKGTHWSESGVVDSYGNGTAMRAAPFGVFFRNDLKELVASVKIDSAITHASPEAEAGALAIAIAAYYAANKDLDHLIEKIVIHLPDSKVKEKLKYTMGWIYSKVSDNYALEMIGTAPDVKQTVPAALYCFLKHDNYLDGVLAAIKAGGDTDTTAAIVGALFGAYSGIKAIDKKFHSVEDFDKLVMLDGMLYNRSDTFFPRS